MSKFFQWLLKNSLWLVAIGLMAASTCFDGVYLESLSAITGFGFAMNVFSDIANPALMYWYGRLQQDKYKAKRDKSKSILLWERIAIAYSWLFSWRQLRGMVYLAEADPLAARLGGPDIASVIEIELLAFAFAGFIPLLLAGIGVLQALIAGRIEEEPAESESKAESPAVELSEPFQCEVCGRAFASQAALNGHGGAHRNKTNGHSIESAQEAVNA